MLMHIYISFNCYWGVLGKKESQYFRFSITHKDLPSGLTWICTTLPHFLCYTTTMGEVFIIGGKNRRKTYKGASWPVDSCKTRVFFLLMVRFEFFISFFLAILFFSRTGWGRRWGGRWGGPSTVLVSFLFTEK